MALCKHLVQPHTHARNKNATKIMVNYKWFYYRLRTTTVADNNAITDDNRRWWYRALFAPTSFHHRLSQSLVLHACSVSHQRTCTVNVNGQDPNAGEREVVLKCAGGDCGPFMSRHETYEQHKSVMGVCVCICMVWWLYYTLGDVFSVRTHTNRILVYPSIYRSHTTEQAT